MSPDSPTDAAALPPARIASIDALRGFVMFMMIFVNDLAGAPHKFVPDWMVHFSDRHKHGSGMTFVDLVFPAFVFIVGMSIPFALGSRLNRGEAVWKTILHVLTRTLALLTLGILMVNGESGGETWDRLMLLSGIFAFCVVLPRNAGEGAQKIWKIVSLVLRIAGFAALIFLAFTFPGRHPIITLSPLHIHASWFGILGIIGWAYFIAAMTFLVFRGHRTALLGCIALFLCFYAADDKGAFSDFWLSHYVSFADTFGSHGAIATAGVLLASILVAADKRTHSARANFTFLFIAGFAAAALLLNGLYGISKNDATPSWCLWSCAITAALWLGFYFFCDVKPVKVIARAFSVAGQNVLLAYLISEMLPSVSGMIAINLMSAIAGSALCATLLLLFTAGLNRTGFRLKL
jgi:heparan-alpha-glucosaminide N-acetyltransferase